MTIIVYIFALVAFVFIAFDFGYNFNVWQKRIHIGRWSEPESWYNAVKKRAKKWLRHTPIVFRKDKSRLLLWDVMCNNLSNSTIQSWQKAGLLMGIYADREKISNQLIAQISASIMRVKHVDVAMLAYALLNITDQKDDIKKSMDYVYTLILETMQNNETIPYRKGLEDLRYVDTIGLVCPFLVKYGITYSCENAINLAEKQIEEFYGFLHPQTKTPPHAYNIVQKTPLGVYDWGRGIGWYILGITECYINLPEDCGFKKSLKTKILELAGALESYQLESGGFSSSIFNKTEAESSATVLCGLLYDQCCSITMDEKYQVMVNGVIGQLMKYTQRDGSVDLCQGDTKGLGNYSVNLGYMPFVQGLTILLYHRHRNCGK